MTGEQRLREFAQGRIVMMVASTKAIPFLRENMGDGAFGVTTIPSSGFGGKYNISLSGIYAGINVNSDYPGNAWAFVSFLSEKSPLFCEMLKAVPGMLSEVIPGDYVKNDPIYSKAWDIYESSGIVNGFLKNPKAEEYENAFFEEMQAFFRSTRPPQETINAIQQKWDTITGK
jgi:multiple sugar transport system substrate-binding protein